MSKRLDRIAKIEEQMTQLANQRKQEVQKHKAEERKARTKRLCSRHGLLEKYMPDLITITDEQFETFIRKGINTSYGRDTLTKIIASGEESDTQKTPTGATQQTKPTQSVKPSNTANRNPTAESAKADGGATVEG